MSPTRARLVLIEDNPADVLLVREAIRRKGLDVDLTCCPEASEGIALLTDPALPAPDIILLDLNLPKGDGIIVIDVLRQSGLLSQARVAILTSSPSPRDIQRAKDLGVGYILKHSTLNEFLSTVGDAVANMLESRAASTF